jgi:hypothetical protein
MKPRGYWDRIATSKLICLTSYSFVKYPTGLKIALRRFSVWPSEKLQGGKLWAVGRNLRFTGDFGLQKFLARIHSLRGLFCGLERDYEHWPCASVGPGPATVEPISALRALMREAASVRGEGMGDPSESPISSAGGR